MECLWLPVEMEMEKGRHKSQGRVIRPLVAVVLDGPKKARSARREVAL